MSKVIENFEAMLAAGNDNALLRYSLGNAYLASEPKTAVVHLLKAVQHDENYSAAWKLLGKAQTAAEQVDAAISSYEQGINVAESNGDIQAVKEMRVFLKRLQKT